MYPSNLSRETFGGGNFRCWLPQTEAHQFWGRSSFVGNTNQSSRINLWAARYFYSAQSEKSLEANGCGNTNKGGEFFPTIAETYQFTSQRWGRVWQILFLWFSPFAHHWIYFIYFGKQGKFSFCKLNFATKKSKYIPELKKKSIGTGERGRSCAHHHLTNRRSLKSGLFLNMPIHNFWICPRVYLIDGVFATGLVALFHPKHTHTHRTF